MITGSDQYKTARIIQQGGLTSFLRMRPIKGIRPVAPVKLPSAGLNAFGVSISSGNVIENQHSGNPYVIPWVPQRPVATTSMPHEKGGGKTWRSENPAAKPVYTKSDPFFLGPPPDPRIRIENLIDKKKDKPTQSVSGVPGGVGGGGGGIGGGGGGTGGGGRQLK